MLAILTISPKWQVVLEFEFNDFNDLNNFRNFNEFSEFRDFGDFFEVASSPRIRI